MHKAYGFSKEREVNQKRSSTSQRDSYHANSLGRNRSFIKSLESDHKENEQKINEINPSYFSTSAAIKNWANRSYTEYRKPA